MKNEALKSQDVLRVDNSLTNIYESVLWVPSAYSDFKDEFSISTMCMYS